VRRYVSDESDLSGFVCSIGVVTVVADSVLPDLHQPLYATFMQIHPYLFGVCKTSTQEAWTLQGLVPGSLAHPEMQPLGRFRV
jgi:hypothetical protein